AAIGASLALGGLSLATVALADVVSNDLDGSVDSTAEVMALNQNGAAGSTRLFVQPQNGDGKNGCNITGSTSMTVSVSSSSDSVATVSPTSITFNSCPASISGPLLTVTPHNAGTATVSVSETSNTTAGTFDTAPATFTVDVAAQASDVPSAPAAAPGATPHKKCKKKHKRSAESAKKKKCKKKKKKS